MGRMQNRKMRKQIVILITGGIGSGKTTVCTIFELLGIPVYNSDEKAKFILDHSTVLKHKIEMRFGKEFITDSGKVDKSKLGEKVFTNQQDLNFLNNLIHPLVRQDFENWKLNQKSELVIIESALLNKSKSSYVIDKQILVLADKKTRLERVMKRDSADQEKVQNRMKRQPQTDQELHNSDFIIQNNGKRSLIKQSLEIYKKLISEFPTKC